MRSIKFLRTRINDCAAASLFFFFLPPSSRWREIVSRWRGTYFCSRTFVYYLPRSCVVMRPTGKVTLKPMRRGLRRVTLIASGPLFFSSLMLSTGNAGVLFHLTYRSFIGKNQAAAKYCEKWKWREARLWESERERETSIFLGGVQSPCNAGEKKRDY